MTTTAVFSAEPELDDCTVAPLASRQPAAEVDDEWMDDDFDRELEERLARDYPVLSPEEYLECLRRRVEAARAEIAAGQWKTHEEVEAYFAARRAGQARTSVT